MMRQAEKSTATGRQPIPASFPGIPGYRFLQTIARSSYSDIHVAHSEELRHNVAIKVLRTGSNFDGQRIVEERFERERELLMRVRHPAIVDVYDWGHGDGFSYIVTEYFPSGSLELRIRNLMTVRDSVDIFLQIAGALVALHQAGLCHRDLKPANVMMRPDGRVVLIDFGLAKHAATQVDMTGTGEIFGTPYYMSPEQGHGQPLDARSDLYSLGVIFYEMLMRKKPYVGPTPMAVLYMHANAPLPVLEDGLAGYQPLLDRLLAKEPANRFASADELLADVRRLQAAG